MIYLGAALAGIALLWMLATFYAAMIISSQESRKEEQREIEYKLYDDISDHPYWQPS